MSLEATIRKAIFNYDRLPDIMKYQVELLSEELSKDKRVAEEYATWKREYENITFAGREISGKELRKLLLMSCIFRYVSALKVSEEKTYPILEVYNEAGVPIIRLTSLITEGSYVKLFRGRFIHERYSGNWGTEKDVVVKLYESRDGKNNTAFEIDQYRMISDPSPSLGINAYLWNVPVLIMKPMEKLSKNEDENEVGIQILQQLPVLHRYTTHSDLKVQNLMKETNSKTSQGKPEYRFIDLGGCARERMGNGFRRRTWSSHWALQKRGKVMTNPKYDLLELGHTLTAIKYRRQHSTSRHPGLKKRTFTGRLKKYMSYVQKIDDLNTDYKNYGPHYKALIEILQGSKGSKSHVSSSSHSRKPHKPSCPRISNTPRTCRGLVTH